MTCAGTRTRTTRTFKPLFRAAFLFQKAWRALILRTRPNPAVADDTPPEKDDSAGGICWLKHWQLPPALPTKDEAP